MTKPISVSLTWHNSETGGSRRATAKLSVVEWAAIAQRFQDMQDDILRRGNYPQATLEDGQIVPTGLIPEPKPGASPFQT